MTKPKFDHDCDNCQYVGNFKEYDLYFCNTTPTVIARYGNEGSEYASGMVFATPEGIESLYQAKLKSIELGLYKEEEL